MSTHPGLDPGPQPGQRQGTRERILETSLRLFTEQGYDGTSLREIAEELGVTKAALYYHFQSKDEILDSLLATISDQAAALAEWADHQPPGDATRRELLRRAVDIAYGPAGRVIAMMQQNQTAMRDGRTGLKDPPIQLLQRVIAPLAPPGASYEDQIRARTALVSIFFGAFAGSDIDAASEQERRDVALRIALGILAPERATRAEPGPARASEPGP